MYQFREIILWNAADSDTNRILFHCIFQGTTEFNTAEFLPKAEPRWVSWSMNIWYVREACFSPTPSWSEALEIHDRVTLDFYLGLSQLVKLLQSFQLRLCIITLSTVWWLTGTLWGVGKRSQGHRAGGQTSFLQWGEDSQYSGRSHTPPSCAEHCTCA